MKATTRIKVDAIYRGKVIATHTETIEGYKKIGELTYGIGYATEEAAKKALARNIDMLQVDCAFNVEIRNLYDGHM